MENKNYEMNEVLNSAIEYFKGDELSAKVWVNKYALKDSYGNIYELNPNDMHWRLANELARIESKYPNPLKAEELFDLIRDFKYIVPQGSPMSGIGNDFQISSISNCFVIGNNAKSDSYGGIIKTDEEQVQLMKRRGGVGHDLSHIRPKGSPVKNSALTSTGIVPFMERYSNSTREVAQDGRRGALMLSVSVKHPDSEDFIDAKLEQGKITGANISVKIHDDFMLALTNKQKYIQQYPVNSITPQVLKEINTEKLWKKIIHNAWKSAEPGILFWDTIINESVADCYADLGFETVSTNPCGELPLCPYDSCRLLAINLYSYVENPFTYTSKFNFELFKEHVIYAQRMMDDIVDIEIEKIDKILNKIESDPETDYIKLTEKTLWTKIKDKCETGRRTGVGITAEGDMLAALGYRYGTEEATAFSELVHKTLAIEVYRSSVIMAKERGSFKIYNTEKESNNPFIKRLKEADSELYNDMTKYGRRNIACLTIAPTGTTSMMTQTTSGIEPVFMPVYTRRKKVNPNDKNSKVDFVDEVGDSWEEFNVFHHKFLVWMEVNGYDITKKYSESEINEIIKLSPYFKATSTDIDWLEKVKMQGKIQKWIDHSISVTINLPSTATEELVSELYIEAWKSGCKGCTVYRDGSRSGVLVSSTEKKINNETSKIGSAEKRPKKLKCKVVRFNNGGEKWVSVVGLLNDKPYEIFTGLLDKLNIPNNIEEGWVIRNMEEKPMNNEYSLEEKKLYSRYDFGYKDKDNNIIIIEGLSTAFKAEYWNYAKLISGLLRHNMPLEYVIKVIKTLNLDEQSINTWKNGVIRTLKKFLENGVVIPEKCPKCGGRLIMQDGCSTCIDCGHSKCS